jgi:phytoene dehydrogenase-like protein
MPEFDAVVIGSGPNGLSAAVALAQRQWKVLVLEAADTPGGGTRTKELTLPGFLHDVCSAVHPTGVASPFFQSLGLEEHGLRWLHPDVPLAHPLSEGRAALLHRSLDQTARNLCRDEAAYRLLFEELVSRAGELYPDIFSPLSFPRSPLLMARFGMAALMPATLLAKGLFRTEEAQALLAGNAAHTVLPLEHAMTSAVAVMLQMSAHAVGWPVAAGGSQAISRALVSKLETLGGKLQCSNVVRSMADLPAARAYLFDTSPRVMTRICGDALPSRYVRRLESYRHGAGVFKVDYALSEPVPWLNDACRHAGTVHVGGTLAEVCRSEAQAHYGEHAEQPFVLVAQPSACDPSRAPEGKAVLWAYCHVPAGSSADMQERITSQIERYAPGFRETILAAHTMNCAQMEHYNANYIGGDVVGGANSWDQIMTRPILSASPYATPHPKIFLCSASTPPAGGVHGMCGWNAAAVCAARLS